MYDFERRLRKAIKEKTPKRIKKSKSKPYGLFSKRAWRMGHEKEHERRRQTYIERSKKTDEHRFREKVKSAKEIKAQRQKYVGNEPVGFQDKTIKRDKAIQNAERKLKVKYGGSNTWYV